MTYKPDAEAVGLAWERAQRVGARQSRRHLTDVAVMRRLHAQADDPLALERDGPDLADDDVPWRTGDPTMTRFIPAGTPLTVAVGQVLSPFMQKMTEAVAAIDQAMAGFKAAVGASDKEAMRLLGQFVDEARQLPVPTDLHVARSFRHLVAEYHAEQGLTTTASLRDLAAVLQPTERTRHGRAAVCPRHGPTRGGTCWRCQR